MMLLDDALNGQSRVPADPRRKKLLIIHGEKGGIGKSLLARLLVSFLHTVGMTMPDRVRVFDADGEGRGAQLTRTVPGTVPVDLTDPTSSALVLDSLMGSETIEVAVLDLGARQHREMRDWLYAADTGALVEEGLLDITVFWLVGNTVDSAVMLDEAFDDFAECALVVVLNRFFGNELPNFEAREQLQSRLKARMVPSVDLPPLSSKIARIVDPIPAPLHAISLPSSAGGQTFPEVGFSVRRILGTWMGEFYAGLEDAAIKPLILPLAPDRRAAATDPLAIAPRSTPPAGLVLPRFNFPTVGGATVPSEAVIEE